MAEPAVSSGNGLYDTYLRQDLDLRKLAHKIWMDSQASKVCIGYAAVEGMIEIDMTLPIPIRVKQQAQRLEHLKQIHENLAGHTHGSGSLEGSGSLGCSAQGSFGRHGRDGGTPQMSVQSQQIAGSKRAPIASLQTRPPKVTVIRKLSRNKVGEPDVQKLITAARPASQQNIRQGLTPPSFSRVKFKYMSEFVRICIEIQHRSYWLTDTPLILTPAAIIKEFSQHMADHKEDFIMYIDGEWPAIDKFPHKEALNSGRPHVTHVWSRAGCVVPIEVECLEGIVRTFWNLGYPALLKFLEAWLRDEQRRPKACADSAELLAAALQEIRRRLPLWPNLGPDDRIRLGLYVLSEDVLKKAWAAANEKAWDQFDTLLKPETKESGRRTVTDAAIEYATFGQPSGQPSGGDDSDDARTSGTGAGGLGSGGAGRSGGGGDSRSGGGGQPSGGDDDAGPSGTGAGGLGSGGAGGSGGGGDSRSCSSATEAHGCCAMEVEGGGGGGRSGGGDTEDDILESLRMPIDALSLTLGSKVKGLFHIEETNLDEMFEGVIIETRRLNPSERHVWVRYEDGEEYDYKGTSADDLWSVSSRDTDAVWLCNRLLALFTSLSEEFWNSNPGTCCNTAAFKKFMEAMRNGEVLSDSQSEEAVLYLQCFVKSFTTPLAGSKADFAAWKIVLHLLAVSDEGKEAGTVQEVRDRVRNLRAAAAAVHKPSSELPAEADPKEQDRREPIESAVCSKCGAPGHYVCTKSNGNRPCTTCYCIRCMGHSSLRLSPSNFPCEVHRQLALLRLEPGLPFQNQNCWECRTKSEGQVRCIVCGKVLCRTHALTTTSAQATIDDAFQCRSCMEPAKFAELRENAAIRLRREICGERVNNHSQLSVVKQHIYKHIRDKQLNIDAWIALVDEFSIYIYNLLVGGLCALASQFLHVLIMINLAVYEKRGVMGLLPLQFAYMMSEYRGITEANAVMFAKVVHAYGSHLLLWEEKRRRTLGLPLEDPASDLMSKVTETALQHRVGRDRIKVGVFAPELLQSSPASDLLHGKVRGCHWDPAKYELWLITYSRCKHKPKNHTQGTRRIYEYDNNNESVCKLVDEFKGKIVYLYVGWSDERNLALLMALNLTVLIHSGGYCHLHIWRLLLMCRVAAVYIEYLAFPSLLLCKLADYTVINPGLLSMIQKGHKNRERTCSVPSLYGSQGFYTKVFPSIADSDPTPCLVYMAGLGRLNDMAMIHYCMDIIHRCGGSLSLRLQMNPDTMYGELKHEASAFCESQGLPNYSNNIEAEPHFLRKEHHLQRGKKMTRLIFLAVGSVTPHTGTVDADLMDSPSVTWPGEEWPGRVTAVNNKLLGLGAVLNATNEEDFKLKVCRLVLDTELYDSVKQHMLGKRESGAAPYSDGADGAILPTVVDKCLQAFKDAGGVRSKLTDIELGEEYELFKLPKPGPDSEFDADLRIRCLGLNVGMRVNMIMGEMDKVSRGRYPWGEHGMKVTLLLEQLGNTLELVSVLGCGATRFTLLAVVRTPSNEKRRTYLEREIGWYEGQELALKLLHTVNGELPTLAGGHNDANFREVRALLQATRVCSQNSRVSKFMPRPMPIFSGGASAGYIKCGADPSSKIVTFMAVEKVRETWHGSQRGSEITSIWRNDGVIDESMRLYARSLLFCILWLHDHIGIVAMDVSKSNIYECGIEEKWLQDPEVIQRKPRPEMIGMCDLGSCHHIGTVRQRAGGAVSRQGPDHFKVLGRRATNEAAAKPATLKRSRVPRPDASGIVILNNADLQRIFEQRNGQGLARTTTGTPGDRCETLRKTFESTRSEDLSPDDCMLVDRGACATMLFAALRPREPGEDQSAYDRMRLAAAKSPAAMQSALESAVMAGVGVKQPDTVASLSNLLYFLLRTDIADRVSTQEALCHPFVSLPVIPPAVYQATRDGGYLFPGGRGPPGSPWADIELPAWNLKHVSGKGLGAFAANRIERSDATPAALYCGFHFTAENREDISEWPPGRCNVSLNSDGTEMCIGELPMEILRERRSPGVYFNAGTTRTNNMRLDRKNAWHDGKGLIYIPMFAKTAIAKDEEGLWQYEYMQGQGANFSFDDSKFAICHDDGRSFKQSGTEKTAASDRAAAAAAVAAK